jgi:hypothetical protein
LENTSKQQAILRRSLANMFYDLELCEALKETDQHVGDDLLGTLTVNFDCVYNRLSIATPEQINKFSLAIDKVRSFIGYEKNKF